MDVIQAVRHYLDKIIKNPQVDGMKVLLLDADTTTIISMVFSQSYLLQHDIYLVEILQATATHDPMPHLDAIAFIRPTSENIRYLQKELKCPKFHSYHLFFSNSLSIEFIEQIAEYDEKEVVQEIQEYYADYLAINDTLFQINIRNHLQIYPNKSPTTAGLTNESCSTNSTFQRNVDGILAVLLSLKKRPIIRYEKGSEVAEKIAREVSAKIQLEQGGLFDFRRLEVQPLLYVLDRRNDPVTPLLSQWTYQAMVHELLQLKENRVNLQSVPGVRKDMVEIVLSCTSDPFFEKHMYANFGDLGMAVKRLVDEYQAKAQTHENIQSIEDMQRFVENYPAFRSQSMTVSKHVTLMGELARIVEKDCLMDVSQLEQELACSDDHNTHFRELVGKLKHSQVKPMNKFRLALLYALRYETNSSVQLKIVKDLLSSAGLSSQKIQLFDAFLKYGGAAVRTGDLYGDRGLKKFMRAMTQGLQGVANVYAQHIPPLIRHLETIVKGQLLDSEFGIVNGNVTPGIKKVRDVIVYICGGVTFEEALKVAELNQRIQSSGQRIILGGPYIHNSTTFVQEVAAMYGIGKPGQEDPASSFTALDIQSL